MFVYMVNELWLNVELFEDFVDLFGDVSEDLICVGSFMWVL